MSMMPYADPPLPQANPNEEDLANFQTPVDGMQTMPAVQQKAPSGVGFDWSVLNVQTQEEYDAKPPEIQHLIHEIKQLGVLPSQEWAANRLISIQKEISARNSPKAQADLAIAQDTMAKNQAERANLDREKQESITRATNEYNRMSGLIDKLKNHPGRLYSTGASNMLPAARGTDAYDFQVLLEQLRGKQFLAGFQSLKGGGQITEIEGTKASAAVARTDPGQSENGFLSGLDDFKSFLTEEYNSTMTKYGAAPQTPAAPADPFQAGKRYRDAAGNVRTYKGNGAWE